MITAQDLYNWRVDTGAISGEEMHLLFQELTGEPSPAGRTPIDIARLKMIANESIGYQLGDWAATVLRALC